MVTIREHSLGHVKGGHGPHFNAEIRPPGAVRAAYEGDDDGAFHGYMVYDETSESASLHTPPPLCPLLAEGQLDRSGRC